MTAEFAIERLSKPKITAIQPYFGSKRAYASTIIEQFHPHKLYWEPFCGSLAVLMSKKPTSVEVANDRNGDIVNLARVLQRRDLAEELYDRCYRTMVCQRIQEEAAAEWKDKFRLTPAGDSPDLERAANLMVASWQGANGFSGTDKNYLSAARRYATTGGNTSVRWRSVVNSIPAWHERLLNVQVWSIDAFELLDRIEDNADNLIYCDPPYVKKGAKYLYDFTPEDHGRLAASLRRFKQAQVVVSYTEHPLVRKLYKGWRFIELATLNNLLNVNTKSPGRSDKASELLICNRLGGGLFDIAA